MRLVRADQPEWASRAHFYYIAARVMRQVLVDFAREQVAQKRGGGREVLPLTLAENTAARRDPDVADIHEALNELGRVDERKARVLEMRYFAGMTAEEIAEVEGLAAVTVARDMRAATAWMRAYLQTA